MKRKLVGFLLTIAFVWLLTLLRVIDFSYPVRLDNDCLNHPVRIISIQDQICTLSDGRQLKLDQSNESQEDFDKRIAHSHNQVEVETDGDSASCALWINERIIAKCGTSSWVGLRIPLFPVKIKGNRRCVLTSAEVLQPQPDQQR